MQRVRSDCWRRCGTVAFCAIGAFGGAVSWAQAQGVLKGANTRPDVPFPSVARVVFGFLFTVALAVLAAYALRRWWPLIARRRAAATNNIRTVDRSVVSATLNVYLLEVDGARYIVAEGRSGVSLTRTQPTTTSVEAHR